MMFVKKVDSDTLERETVNHSFLDIIALVPSPNWLIGLDSLDLCKDEKRVNHARPGVSPMDAATDNGLTFTSPNWSHTEFGSPRTSPSCRKVCGGGWVGGGGG